MGDRALNRWVDILLHDVASPLSSLRASLQAARHELEKKKVVLESGHLDDAWDYSELLGTLLLNLSCLKDGGCAYGGDKTECTYPIEELINPAIRVARLLLRGRGSRGIDCLDLNLIPPVKIDRKRMTLVFFNLLSNAIKFSPDRDVRVSLEGMSSADDQGWEVLVKDWGVGIDPMEAEQVFDFRFRGAKACSLGIPGSGLGLYISQQIATANGCTLRIKNFSKPTVLSLVVPRSLIQG